jgi:hypothetical protein
MLAADRDHDRAPRVVRAESDGRAAHWLFEEVAPAATSGAPVNLDRPAGAAGRREYCSTDLFAVAIRSPAYIDASARHACGFRKKVSFLWMAILRAASAARPEQARLIGVVLPGAVYKGGAPANAARTAGASRGQRMVFSALKKYGTRRHSIFAKCERPDSRVRANALCHGPSGNLPRPRRSRHRLPARPHPKTRPPRASARSRCRRRLPR